MANGAMALRALALLSCSSIAFAAAVTACSDDTGGSIAPDAGAEEAGADASADAEESRDAGGPGEAGAECSFNRDCQLALRCACDESAGCACSAGTRGTGKNGVDPCKDGNDCESAVCVEGPADAGYFCSDECATSADCVGKLPQCTTIAFVGRICIRNGP
ncbi:MAG: hypothetical protein KF819_34800 [Labilithrix sp.]|nr:hypothetical protein [Labilithrix sp.]